MVVFPNAKINLGLSVFDKRPDGFHSIESCMYPINLCDILEVVPGDQGKVIKFSSSGLQINGSTQDNLVVKAYRLLQKEFKLPAVKVHLHKVIAMGAGLGGGSSDAAFMMIVLNELFQLNIDRASLTKFASKLGSDCPFFIHNYPAFSTGKGDILENIELSLKGYYIVIVHPGIHVGTKWAYSQIIPQQPIFPLGEVISKGIDYWRNNLRNDFEQIVFARYPEIGKIKETMYELGAVYSSLSGSGSAVYGLFKDQPRLGNHFKTYFSWEGQL